VYWWAVQVINYCIFDDLWNPGDNFQRKNNFSVIKVISVLIEAMDKFEQYYESEFCDECGSQKRGYSDDRFVSIKKIAAYLDVCQTTAKKILRERDIHMYTLPGTSLKRAYWEEVKSAIMDINQFDENIEPVGRI
jgi:hypothetical protein